MKKVCLVIGAGAGIGGSVGRKFAQEGYHAALCRRSDEEGLQKLVGDIKADGGDATGFLLNAVDDGTLEERMHIARELRGELSKTFNALHTMDLDFLVEDRTAALELARAGALPLLKPQQWVRLLGTKESKLLVNRIYQSRLKLLILMMIYF